MKNFDVNNLKNAIISASNNLFNNKERIDALNIFPVPDGDTGTNMSSTIEKASQNLEKQNHSNINSLVLAVSRDMLLGARGNSGVILSQIFKGFSNTWKNLEVISPKDIVLGLEEATKMAYSSVLKPIEGTILTVIRETAENTKKDFKDSMNMVEVLETTFEHAKKSLKNTPNILPVLKEVGVVDSGGEGLLMILKGFLEASKGNIIEINLNATQELLFASDKEIYTGEFGYCTEVIIELKEVNDFNKKEFSKLIEKQGNSLVVVQDDEMVKVHIHTTQPGKILNFGQKYGEFLTVKIENMTEQANNTKSQANNNESNPNSNIAEKQIKKENAIISCNTGGGFIELMNEYECDYVIEGGQSNNPSAQDILEAINVVNSDNVIILPNNSNIILAAQQASKLVNNKNIHIVPTKTQAEGVTAILNYSPELSMKDNIQEINSSLKNLVVGQVTQAVKDTKLNGVKIEKGNYLMIKNNKIISTKTDVIDAACALVDDMIKNKKHAEVLVIYYGNNLSATEASKIEKYVTKKYDVEVDIQNGSQPIYDFLFGLE